MRGQDHPGLMRFRSSIAGALLGGMLVFVGGAIYAQNAPQIVPRVTGAAAPMGDVPAPPVARPVIDDKRLMRNYPEQPPIIPHSIDNYQGSGAPMISVTHFMDRDGQVLADVTPRRYFCTACHVQQTDAQPLVPSTFKDMLLVGPEKK
jgi:cytochrome c-type protein NapB